MVYNLPYQPSAGPKDGNYSYEVQNPAACIQGVQNMQKIAGRLWKADKNNCLVDINIQVIDARTTDDFNLENIKGSINLPFTELLNSKG